jgi:two-component sensor histidine kinase
MQETAFSESRAEPQTTGFDAAPRSEAGLGALAELALETAARSALDDVALRRVLEALPVAVYTTDPEGRINYFNDAAVVLSGRTPRLGRDKWCVSWRMYTSDGIPLPHDQCPMATTLRDRIPVRGVPILAERPDGTRVPVMPYPTPLHDPAGAFIGALNVLIDISNVKTAEALANRRMEEQSVLFHFTDRLYRAGSLDQVYEAALDAILDGARCQRASILLFDEAGVMRFVAWRGLSDPYRQAVDGHSPWSPDDRNPDPILIPDIEAAEVPEAIRSAVRSESIRALGFIPLSSSGALIGKFMVYYDSPHEFTESEAELSLTIARQLGFSIERMRAEAQRTILVHELNHRVKNTLATVQSLAMQTYRNASSATEARDVLEARLAALSKAHDLLTARSWHAAHLSEVVTGALAPFRGAGRIIRTAGSDVGLSSKQALGLSLALHELATNAVKYGALSRKEGSVGVAWGLDPGNKAKEVYLTWTEADGPPVAMPDRQGFGTRLMQRVLADELGGEVSLDYRPEGLVCTIRFPVWSEAP